MCLAKNKMAAARVGRHFEKRTARKYYLAVVRGAACPETAVIDYDIGEDPSVNGSHKMTALVPVERRVPGVTYASGRKPRTARTHCLLLESGFYDGLDASVVLLKPLTGRRHQLRVHMRSLGLPILGDYTYAADTEPHRMYLHAYRLVLPLEVNPLDVETLNPYTVDKKFTERWRTKCIVNAFHTFETRTIAYNKIDAL